MFGIHKYTAYTQLKRFTRWYIGAAHAGEFGSCSGAPRPVGPWLIAPIRTGSKIHTNLRFSVNECKLQKYNLYDLLP